MLLCFGLAWPLNTLGMLRRRRAEGKNLVFTDDGALARRSQLKLSEVVDWVEIVDLP